MPVSLVARPGTAVTVDDARHVFAAGAGIDRHAAGIAALIEPGFLTEAGWDIDDAVAVLIERMARENHRWG